MNSRINPSPDSNAEIKPESKFDPLPNSVPVFSDPSCPGLNFYPLSQLQADMWLLQQMHPGTSMWTLACTVRLHQPYPHALLAKAIAAATMAYDALRLRFIEREGMLLQTVLPYQDVELAHEDFSSLARKAGQEEWLQSRAETQLPVLAGMVHEFVLLTMDDGSHGFFFRIHQLAVDETGFALLLRKIGQALENLAQGKPADLIPGRSCLSVLAREAAYQATPQIAADIEYWRKLYHTIPDAVPLLPRRHSNSLKIRRHILRVPARLSNQLYNFAAAQNSSVFKVMLAAFAVYVLRVSAAEDAVIGVASADRRPHDEDLIGNLVRIPPLRLYLDGKQAFNELLADLHGQLKQALQHQGLSHTALNAQLRKRDPAFGGLVDLIVAQHPSHLLPPEMEVRHLSPGESQYKLVLYVRYDAGQRTPLELMIDYRDDLFDNAMLDAFLRHFFNILRGALASPASQLGQLPLMCEDEREQIIHGMNATATHFPRQQTVVELFEEQCHRRPSALAVRHLDQVLSYREVNQRANRIARLLRAAGISPGMTVGILAERCVEMMPGLFGILKAGAAFVPIDPDYPPERIHYILQDCGAQILLSKAALMLKVLGQEGQSIRMVEMDGKPEAQDEVNPEAQAEPQDLAYLIYTSGSTGRPKGVEIRHRSLSNLCNWCCNSWNLRADDRLSKFAAFGFDASIFEVFPALVAGASLEVVPDEVRLSPLQVRDWYQQRGVTVAFLPTQFGEQFMQLPEPEALRLLYVGGEKLRYAPKRRYAVQNIYGPTEYTVVTTACMVEGEHDNIPIGRPLDNTRIYILDAYGNPQPVGAAGELCISGEGVARGYRNLPQLTAEKFIANPFQPGERLYRSGDLARWLPNGNLEFLGRLDRQVKIRGFRIELGEVEQAMLQLEGITDAAVCSRKDASGAAWLAGYYVAEQELEEASLRRLLRARLPDYMVPQALMYLPAMPLTPNGKIDLKALPEPLRAGQDIAHLVAPRTEGERKLLALFGEILEVEHISIDDNFFNLGGHSLKAAKLQARIERDLGCRLPLSLIFNMPNVRQLAQEVAAMQTPAPQPKRRSRLPTATAAPAAGAVAEGSFPLSHPQRRQLITELMYPGTTFSSMPLCVRLPGTYDADFLRIALNVALRCFDGLRIHILQEEGQYLQRIMPAREIAFEEYDFSQDNSGAAYASWAKQRSARPLHLLEHDLFEMVLLRFPLQSGGYYLNMHHIIADGVTMRLLTDHVLENYRRLQQGQALHDAPAPSYYQFVMHEREYLASPQAQIDRAYWLQELHDAADEIRFPFARPVELGIRSECKIYVPGADDALLIHELCEDEHVSNYALLMGVLTAWIARVTLLEHMTIGTVSHNRSNSVLKQVAGMCVNSFPVPVKIGAGSTVLSVAREVQAWLRNEARVHLHYPFDLMVSDMRSEGFETAGLMNVVFNCHEWPAGDGRDVSHHTIDFEQPPFHLVVNVAMSRLDRSYMKVWFTYPQGMFSQQDMDAVYADLRAIWRSVEQQPQALISALPQPLVLQGKQPQRSYPLSSAMKRVYLAETLHGTPYNIPLLFDLRGKLDVPRLQEVLRILIQRHEALRTVIELHEGVPVQRVCPGVEWRLEVQEAENADETQIGQMAEAFVRPFCLHQAPLLRAVVLRRAAQHHILLLDIHHIVFDGTSLAIFLQEMLELYRGAALPALSAQFPSFALWEKRMQHSERIRAMEKFWLDIFKNPPPVLDLPTDFPRPGEMDYQGQSAYYKLDANLSRAVNRLAISLDVTPFMLLMAALKTLLARYSGQDDMVIGAGVAGRSHPDYQQTVGMFINVLPVRSQPGLHLAFSDYLRELKKQLLAMYDNQDYPFDRLVEKIGLQRDSSRGALFDVSMVLQNMGLPPDSEAAGVHFARLPYGGKVARSDLMLEIEPQGDIYQLHWEWRTSLFSAATIARMQGHFQNILHNVVNQPDTRLCDIDLLQEQERTQLLYDWNQTAAGAPREKTLHGLFEDAAARYPQHIALSYGERTMSYAELNARANQLGRSLRERGVVPGMIVALMGEHSPELIVGLFGIMKAGACYLPIRPDYPADRIEYILQDSGASLMLLMPEHRQLLGGYQGQVLELSDPSLYAGSAENLPPAACPEDAVYVIYTSGSTGKPKGVQLEHRNIVRLLMNDKIGQPGYFDFRASDVWTFFHSFAFDFSVWEIYTPLAYGARVVIVPREQAINPEAFLDLLKREKVTVLNQTPGAFYNLIAADLQSRDQDWQSLQLRYVIFGGEALKPRMLKEWRQKYPNTALINMYGITETTVHVTYKEIGAAEIESNVSNIGRPIPTLRTYILDQNRKLCPIGVPGEICVGGEGLARCYLGMPEVTAARFIDDPYHPGQKLYLSGDLARMLVNGEMEYLGRIDFQVKIRGHRIELGEIETCLLNHPQVTDAVVIARDDGSGSKDIVAYMVLAAEVPLAALREHLFAQLPDYMLPSHFVILDALPLTPNGKVNRSALPAPGLTIDTGVQFVAARNESEARVVAAWQKCLQLEQISVFDNFFTLGGHSLKAVAVVAELQKHYEVAVNDIFRHQTVARLAQHLKPRKDSMEKRLGELKQLIPARRNSLDPLEFNTRQAQYLSSNQRLAALDLALKNPFQTVFLSGVTGYLGSHLLAQLLNSTQAKVYSVVRAADQVQAQARVAEVLSEYFGADYLPSHAARVVIWAGDLGAPQLGLHAAQWQELVEQVDAILHPAALIKHYGHRAEFEHANVQATRELLALAGSGASGKRKTFHHISTLSVMEGVAEHARHLIFSEDDLDLGQRSENAYIATKYEAEQVVLAARAAGLPAQIFRVGNISVNSRSGKLQRSIEENAFYLRLRAMVALGVAPTVEDEAEVSFVDSLADAIVRLARCQALANETLHMLNPHFIKLSELLCAPELQLNIRPMDLDAFIDLLLEQYDQSGRREDISNFLLHSGWMNFLADSGAKIETPFTILSSRTQDLLQRLDFDWPQVEVKIFNNMVREARGGR